MAEKVKKERLDVLLVARGLASSREKAKAIIMSGIVYVDGNKEDKAGTTFPDTVDIQVKGNTLRYVSRGGLKLEKAMNELAEWVDKLKPIPEPYVEYEYKIDGIEL